MQIFERKNKENARGAKKTATERQSDMNKIANGQYGQYGQYGF